MSPEHEERIYGSVLQRVIYGDDRKEILEMLATNGIVGGDAEEMLGRAHKERNAALRGEAMSKVIKGMLLLGAGVGLFCFFWYGLGVMHRLVFIVSIFMGGYGFWLLVSGIFEVLFPSTVKGSVAPDL